MAIQTGILIQIITTLVLFVLSALPLHKAVRIMKGKTKFPKTMFIVIISGIVISLINSIISVWGGFVAFILLLWIYHKSFKLKWWKAFMVWTLHLAFVIVGSIIISMLFSLFTKVSAFFP
jgi:hypothetical protein